MTLKTLQPTSFLFALMAAATVIISVNMLLHTYPSLNPRGIIFNRFYVFLIGLPFITLALINKASWSMFGFTKLQWKKAVFEGFLISGLILPILIFLKICLNTPFTLPGIYAYTYFSSVIFQQSVRTCIQNQISVLLGAIHPLWSCLITGMLFGLIHTHFGFSAVLLTFLIGVLFSVIYLRHNNIYGLIIIHNILGISAFSLHLL